MLNDYLEAMVDPQPLSDERWPFCDPNDQLA